MTASEHNDVDDENEAGEATKALRETIINLESWLERGEAILKRAIERFSKLENK